MIDMCGGWDVRIGLMLKMVWCNKGKKGKGEAVTYSRTLEKVFESRELTSELEMLGVLEFVRPFAFTPLLAQLLWLSAYPVSPRFSLPIS